jgi:predicted O-linked N-acetylglucosamine transferase (SPINDLY family)
MSSNGIGSLRNYISQHITKIINTRYPQLTPLEKQLKLQIIFKQIINNIRHITLTNQLDKYNTPMGFLFQHLKPEIVTIIANCSDTINKTYLDKHLTMSFDWNIRLFQCMKTLNTKDIMIWYFLQIPYYNPTSLNSDILIKQRNLYEQMLDYFLQNSNGWTEQFHLSEAEFTFICNQTCMTYAIAYHNQNNVSILSKYCRLLRKICPWLNYYSPKLAEKVLKRQYDKGGVDPKPAKVRKRVCFISDSFVVDSSVLRDRIPVIGKLDKERFDVYVASFCKLEHVSGIIAGVFMNRFKERYIYLGSSLGDARTILEKYEFDVIIYPDLGMKLLPTLLAYSRIAGVQVNTWGHSETCGIDTIDYFISSRWFEKDLLDAKKHYTEKLVLFDSLGTYYISPSKLFIDNNPRLAGGKWIMRTREELGFGVSDHIYCCLQTFYKINDEFEKCIARILELDPHGVVLFSNSYPFCKNHLERLYSNLGENKIKRVKWFPSMEKQDFLNLVAISDVCLDPFPFGGCNTSYDAFDFNVPVITWAGEYLHGRFTVGLYARMGLSDCECIVADGDSYALIASSIGVNEKLRHKINRNIEMNKGKIFQENESVREWNMWLDSV